MSMNKRFIAIAGNIGSGKTTLTRLLADHYSWVPYFEVVKDNPYLEDFYGDMKRWSLQLQMFFLSKRFEAHKGIARSSSSAVQDRSIYEDAHIFARTLNESGHMEDRDYQNYRQVYEMMIEYLEPPDLLVYVRRDIPQLKERIKERGRGYEQNITDAYLESLNNRYDEWIQNYRLGKVITFNANDLDFKHNQDDFDFICNKIESSLEQPELFFRF